MKIIKEGIVPHFKGTCFFCGCELECEKSEGTISCGDVPTLIVWCPTERCGNSIRMYPIIPKIKKKRK